MDFIPYGFNMDGNSGERGQLLVTRAERNASLLLLLVGVVGVMTEMRGEENFLLQLKCGFIEGMAVHSVGSLVDQRHAVILRRKHCWNLSITITILDTGQFPLAPSFIHKATTGKRQYQQANVLGAVCAVLLDVRFPLSFRAEFPITWELQLHMNWNLTSVQIVHLLVLGLTLFLSLTTIPFWGLLHFVLRFYKDPGKRREQVTATDYASVWRGSLQALKISLAAAFWGVSEYFLGWFLTLTRKCFEFLRRGCSENTPHAISNVCESIKFREEWTVQKTVHLISREYLRWKFRLVLVGWYSFWCFYTNWYKGTILLLELEALKQILKCQAQFLPVHSWNLITGEERDHEIVQEGLVATFKGLKENYREDLPEPMVGIMKSIIISNRVVGFIQLDIDVSKEVREVVLQGEILKKASSPRRSMILDFNHLQGGMIKHKGRVCPRGRRRENYKILSTISVYIENAEIKFLLIQACGIPCNTGREQSLTIIARDRDGDTALVQSDTTTVPINQDCVVALDPVVSNTPTFKIDVNCCNGTMIKLAILSSAYPDVHCEDNGVACPWEMGTRNSSSLIDSEYRRGISQQCSQFIVGPDLETCKGLTRLFLAWGLLGFSNARTEVATSTFSSS